MAKYIHCDCCGKRIDFNESIYRFKGYCGIYCSADCFADAYADCDNLNEDIAANCCAKVHDDDEDKRKLKENIVSAEAQIKELEKQIKMSYALLTQYEEE